VGWGLWVGGLGPHPTPPTPQSPIPNPQSPYLFIYLFFKKLYKYLYNINKIKKIYNNKNKNIYCKYIIIIFEIFFVL
jgi:hypothetical protein